MSQSKSFSITTKNKLLEMKWIRTPKVIWDSLSKMPCAHIRYNEGMRQLKWATANIFAVYHMDNIG